MSEQIRRAEKLFQQALDLRADARSPFLDRQCADNPDLRRDVDSLLEHYERAVDGFLQTPPGAETSDTAEAALPDRIGHYRIIRELGRGGMGTVYEAEQQQPRRTVALKVLRPGLATPELLRRFHYEAQALGRLQHPNIAQIIEAGLAGYHGEQRPFFAMELVRGSRLDVHVGRAVLSTEQRLELFARICDAVEHAHQKGVIHRDLKPSNILVVADDDTGAHAPGSRAPVGRIGHPKVLDFGLAKLTQGDLAITTMATEVGRVQGTLSYMSPEQARGRSDDIDFRTDVYSLGVILYELLTRRLPYNLQQTALPEAVRVICDESPQRPGSISRHLRGDLETIVGKALEKERERRYQSAAELAADVRRYLNNQPVTARPPSAAYQFAKFARRNKGLVAGAAAAVLALAIGLVATTAALFEARQQRDIANESSRRATTEAAKSRAVNEFLRDMLASVSPARARGEEVSVRSVLQRAAEQIEEGRFAAQPDVEAAVRLTIGNTLGALGDYDAARTHLEQALRIQREVQGPSDASVAPYADALGALIQATGDYQQALLLFEDALRIRREALGPDHPDIATSLFNVALALDHQGRFQETEKTLRRALEIRRRHFGDQNSGVANVKFNLAALLKQTGDLATAEVLYREALHTHRTLLGDDHPQTIMDLTGLGSVLRAAGKADEAARVYEEALAAGRKVHGDDHPMVALILNNLGVLLASEQKLDRALQIHGEALRVRTAVYGERSAAVAGSLHNLARVHRSLGRPDRAEELYTRTLDIRIETLSEAHPRVAETRYALGQLFAEQARYQEAEDQLRRALAIFLQKLPHTHWKIAETRTALGAVLMRLGRLDDAEPLLLRGWETVRDDPSVRPDLRDKTGKKLIELYQAWNRPELAAQYRNSLDAMADSPVALRELSQAGPDPEVVANRSDRKD